MSAELEKIKREKLEAGFREVLASDGGKRVIYWMLEQCAIYRDAYTGDDAATNYTLGMQASGRKLIAEIDSIDPRFYPQLLLSIAEINQRDEALSKALSNQEDDDDDDGDQYAG